MSGTCKYTELSVGGHKCEGDFGVTNATLLVCFLVFLCVAEVLLHAFYAFRSTKVAFTFASATIQFGVAMGPGNGRCSRA